MRKGENIMQKFWMVVGVSRSAIPEVILDENEKVKEGFNKNGFDFDSQLKAVKTAEHMAIKHPEEEYYIMESVKCSKAEVRAVTT